MSGRLGIDYAWGGPPPLQALRRAHIQFVGRYLSLDASKNLTRGECVRYKTAGIEVKPIWETTAERARQGEQAGIEDAKRAIFELRALGIIDLPPAIYLAIDFDAAGPEIEAYFKGARSILLAHTGAYGGYKAIRHLFDHGLISHAWQTYAWSNGQWDPRARLRQYSNGHQLAGLDVDYDIELADPQAPYVPGDEHNWIHEYDRLQRELRAPWRRRQLRRLMTARRKQIWRLAHQTGWNIRNRDARWRALVDRTE